MPATYSQMVEGNNHTHRKRQREKYRERERINELTFGESKGSVYKNALLFLHLSYNLCQIKITRKCFMM